MYFRSLTLALLFSGLLASPTVRADDWSCGFKKRSSLEKSAAKAFERVGRHVPCSWCTDDSPIAGAGLREPVGATERKMAESFERLISDRRITPLLAQGPIEFAIATTSPRTYPHSMLVDRVVIVPERWLEIRKSKPRFDETLEFVAAHEIAHFIHESTIAGRPALDVRDHLLVDAIGARLMGIPIDEALALLSNTEVPGEFSGDVARRIECLSKLK